MKHGKWMRENERHKLHPVLKKLGTKGMIASTSKMDCKSIMGNVVHFEEEKGKDLVIELNEPIVEEACMEAVAPPGDEVVLEVEAKRPDSLGRSVDHRLRATVEVVTRRPPRRKRSGRRSSYLGECLDEMSE